VPVSDPRGSSTRLGGKPSRQQRELPRKKSRRQRRSGDCRGLVDDGTTWWPPAERSERGWVRQSPGKSPIRGYRFVSVSVRRIDPEQILQNRFLPAHSCTCSCFMLTSLPCLLYFFVIFSWFLSNIKIGYCQKAEDRLGFLSFRASNF
jgi:hypothetical protein